MNESSSLPGFSSNDDNRADSHSSLNKNYNVNDENNHQERIADKYLKSSNFLPFSRICCINLDRRSDRWKSFIERTRRILGEDCMCMESKKLCIERFSAVDGWKLWQSLQLQQHQNGNSNHDRDVINIHHNRRVLMETCCLEWDATNNAKYDRNIVPPMKKQMTSGEIGCILSHITLYRQLANYQAPTSTKTTTKTTTTNNHNPTMLILEDDVVFYPGTKRQQSSSSLPEFVTVFQRVWNILPKDWDILYLGFCNIGPRIPVAESSSNDNINTNNDHSNCKTIEDNIPLVQIFRPTYGFYTHAYALTQSAARVLLSHLPVSAPLDVWLADHDWFGLNVYCCAVIDNPKAASRSGGVSLISQRRVDSDILHSAHH